MIVSLLALHMAAVTVPTDDLRLCYDEARRELSEENVQLPNERPRYSCGSPNPSERKRMPWDYSSFRYPNPMKLCAGIEDYCPRRYDVLEAGS